MSCCKLETRSFHHRHETKVCKRRELKRFLNMNDSCKKQIAVVTLVMVVVYPVGLLLPSIITNDKCNILVSAWRSNTYNFGGRPCSPISRLRRVLLLYLRYGFTYVRTTYGIRTFPIFITRNNLYMIRVKVIAIGSYGSDHFMVEICWKIACF
jgi:hypothetical protein